MGLTLQLGAGAEVGNMIADDNIMLHRLYASFKHHCKRDVTRPPVEWLHSALSLV